jgi:hypothetical protein
LTSPVDELRVGGDPAHLDAIGLAAVHTGECHTTYISLGDKSTKRSRWWVGKFGKGRSQAIGLRALLSVRGASASANPRFGFLLPSPFRRPAPSYEGGCVTVDCAPCLRFNLRPELRHLTALVALVMVPPTLLGIPPEIRASILETFLHSHQQVDPAVSQPPTNHHLRLLQVCTLIEREAGPLFRRYVSLRNENQIKAFILRPLSTSRVRDAEIAWADVASDVRMLFNDDLKKVGHIGIPFSNL